MQRGDDSIFVSVQNLPIKNEHPHSNVDEVPQTGTLVRATRPSRPLLKTNFRRLLNCQMKREGQIHECQRKSSAIEEHQSFQEVKTDVPGEQESTFKAPSPKKENIIVPVGRQ